MKQSATLSEAVTLKQVDKATAAGFIRDDISCSFEIVSVYSMIIAPFSLIHICVNCLEFIVLIM